MAPRRAAPRHSELRDRSEVASVYVDGKPSAPDEDVGVVERTHRNCRVNQRARESCFFDTRKSRFGVIHVNRVPEDETERRDRTKRRTKPTSGDTDVEQINVGNGVSNRGRYRVTQRTDTPELLFLSEDTIARALYISLNFLS